MFGFLIIAILVTLTEAADINKLAGEWVLVEAFGDVGEPQEPCPRVIFKTTNEYSKCQGDIDVPNIQINSPDSKASNNINKSPVIIVENENEVTEAMKKKKCISNGVAAPLAIFRFIDEDYVVMYSSYFDKGQYILLARSIPTDEQLDDLVKRTKMLQVHPGVVTCTERINKKTERRV